MTWDTTTSDDDAIAFLTQSGAPALKFPDIGTTHTGTVLSLQKRQQTDMDSGKPKTWDNGDPMWEVVATLQTTDRDGADDDGRRRLFIRGQMTSAVRDALAKAKHSGSPVGGTLTVRYNEDGEPARKGWTAPKVYVAKFEPADPFADTPALAAASGGDDLL